MTATAAIIVEIESVLEPIVPEFIENRKRDCVTIHELIEQGDFAKICFLGHRMKGAGGSYGFDDISEIGELLEDAARDKDSRKLQDVLSRLVSYLEQVSVVYV